MYIGTQDNSGSIYGVCGDARDIYGLRRNPVSSSKRRKKDRSMFDNEENALLSNN